MNIWQFTLWKWPTTSVESTKWAAFPKKEWMPVAMTTASISPCLQIEPVNTWSPVLLVTGRDSPVRADCIVEGKPLGQINQADMLTQQTYQQLQPYCYMETLAANVNCVITWSTFTGSPSSRRASAGMISPSLMLTISPGTKIEASSSCHCPSLKTWRSHHTHVWTQQDLTEILQFLFIYKPLFSVPGETWELQRRCQHYFPQWSWWLSW